MLYQVLRKERKLLYSAPHDTKPLQQLVNAHGCIGRFLGAKRNSLAFLNDVWLLHTTLGQFIVKRHVREVGPERLSWTERFLRKLYNYDYPCDLILPSCDGSPVIKIDNSMMSVHTYLEGHCIRGGIGRLSEKQQDSAITALARYHSAVLSVHTEGDEPPPLVPDFTKSSTPYSSERAILPSPIPLLYSDKVECLQSYIFKDSNFISRRVRILLEKILLRLDMFFASLTYISLPRTIIHGDFRPKNMVFRGDTFAGLFDWDLVQCAPRLVDVCGRFAQHYVDLTYFEGDSWALKKYLTKYAIAAAKFGFPIDDNEEQAFPEILQAGIIRTAVTVAIFMRYVPLLPGESQAHREREAKRRLLGAVKTLSRLASR